MTPSALFLVKVTAKAGAGLAAAYQWEEWWLLPGAPPVYAVKAGGRYSGPLNLSYCPAGELAVGDFALARQGAGAGGLLWELLAVGPGVSSLAYGSAILGTAYQLVSTVGAYEDTGLSLALPDAGAYQLFCGVKAFAISNVVGGGVGVAMIQAKLYDATAAADVPDANVYALSIPVDGKAGYGSPLISCPPYVVGAGAVLKLYAVRSGGAGVWTQSTVQDGSWMSYLKLG